ncbi:unnamed protein product [Gordionus sp. m RMFG-2023]
MKNLERYSNADTTCQDGQNILGGLSVKLDYKNYGIHCHLLRESIINKEKGVTGPHADSRRFNKKVHKKRKNAL